MEKRIIYYATGKRKNAIARTWLKPGKGEIIVNDRPMGEYFTIETSRKILSQPLALTDKMESFDIKILVKGGGISEQAGAVRHGITKALNLGRSCFELNTSWYHPLHELARPANQPAIRGSIHNNCRLAGD